MTIYDDLIDQLVNVQYLHNINGNERRYTQ